MTEEKGPHFVDLGVGETDQTRAYVAELLGRHGLTAVQGFDPQEDALARSGSETFRDIMDLAEAASREGCILVAVPMPLPEGRTISLVMAKQQPPGVRDRAAEALEKLAEEGLKP
jgi:sugar phosphate isomerase/epimerase